MSHWQKPPLGVRLNPGHPLARGLVGCWIMNEGSGNKVFDLSGNGSAGAITGSGWYWTGEGWVEPSTSAIIQIQNNSLIQSAFDPGNYYTVTLGAKAIANGFDTTYFLSKNNNCFSIYTWDDPCFAVRRGDGTTSYQYGLTSSPFTAGVPFVLSIAGTQTAISFTYDVYVDGRYTQTKSRNGQNTGSTSDPINISANDSGSQDRRGEYRFLYIHSRKLTPSEVQSLHTNPYQMFEPDPIWMLAQSAAAPGGLLINSLEHSHTIDIVAINDWDLQSIDLEHTHSLATTGGIPTKHYSRGDVAALPSNDADLETLLTESEYSNLLADDDLYAGQSAIDKFSVFLFKDRNSGASTSDNINISVIAKSSTPGTTSPIYLQIYNRNTSSWVTLATNDTVAAATEFLLEGSI